jgi:uncharacterized membrane protein YoaK (UPF0700 family)
VFTANMTGNVVFLGFAMASAPGLSIPRSAAALAAFIIGATIGGRLAARMGAGPRLRWTTVGFGVEAILLLAAAALAAGAGDDLLHGPPWVYGLIALTGLAMGLRNAVVRKLAERDLTTTVLTLTITGIAADSSLGRGERNPGWGRRASSVADVRGRGGRRVAAPIFDRAAPRGIRHRVGALRAGSARRRCWPRQAGRVTSTQRVFTSGTIA